MDRSSPANGAARETGVRAAGSFALLAMVGVVSGCGPTESVIEPADARELVAQGATLLDVRTDAEWAAGHLPGARHSPIDSLATRLDELPRDRPVVVYCRSGARSARAAALLRDAGFDARDLGGMHRWQE